MVSRARGCAQNCESRGPSCRQLGVQLLTSDLVKDFKIVTCASNFHQKNYWTMNWSIIDQRGSWLSAAIMMNGKCNAICLAIQLGLIMIIALQPPLSPTRTTTGI